MLDRGEGERRMDLSALEFGGHCQNQHSLYIFHTPG